MAKYLDIGTVQVKEGTYIALGKKNKPAYNKYDLTVELVVKDHTGKVVAKQTDGFINLVDPRTQPDDLLAKGLITEQHASDMKARAEKLPEYIKKVLQVKLS